MLFDVVAGLLGVIKTVGIPSRKIAVDEHLFCGVEECSLQSMDVFTI